MKRRMLAALITALWLVGALAAADDGEAEKRARQERLDGYLAAQFGADWAQTVAAYEGYYLGATAEDGTLFAISTAGGRNALFVLNYADGEQVSAYACPNALRPDEIPAFSFELENEIGFAYSDGSAQIYELGSDGRWRLSFYCTQAGALTVSLESAPLIAYWESGDPTGGKAAAWPAFETDLETIDVTALPREEASLLAALTDERDGVRATLAESEMEGARFTAVCAASDESCALTVFADWTWETKTPEEIGICAYRVLAEGRNLATVDLPGWNDRVFCYEGEPAHREIADWAQMPRPRTLTLVPVDGNGAEYPEAAMEFTLNQ